MKKEIIFEFAILNIALLFCSKPQGKNSFFELDTIITIPNKYISDVNYRINSLSINDGKVYVYLPTENDSLIFFYYDLKKRFSSYLIFDLSWLTPPFEIASPTCQSFFVDSAYVYLHFFEGVLLFKRISNNTLELTFAKELVNPSDYRTYIHNYEKSWFDKQSFRIYFARNYNLLVPINDFKKTEITIFDINENKFVKTINPYFNCIEFTHFSPLELIDVGNKFIVFSQTVEYQIEIYDKNLNKLFVAKRNPNTWIPTDTTKLVTLRSKYDTLHASTIIRELDDYDKPGSRIKVIRFIDDTTFAVFYTASNTNEKISNVSYFDLWTISKNGLQLILKDIKISPPSLDDNCDISNYPFYPLFNPPIFYYNEVVSIATGSSAEIMFQLGKPYGQIKKESNEYIIKNDLNSLIQFFKFKLK